MAYNPSLYQPNQYTTNVAPTYPMYNSNLNGVNQYNQSYYPPINTTLPLSLSATYTKGEIGASSYPVAPGNTVILLDSDTIDTDNPIIYIKTTGYDGKSQTIKKISGTVSYPNEQGLFTIPTKEEVKEKEIDLSGYTTSDELGKVKKDVSLVSLRLDEYDETIKQIKDSLENIDNRFSNMFSAFTGNNNSQVNNINDNSNNNNNNSNKKNKNDYKKGGNS